MEHIGRVLLSTGLSVAACKVVVAAGIGVALAAAPLAAATLLFFALPSRWTRGRASRWIERATPFLYLLFRE